MQRTTFKSLSPIFKMHLSRTDCLEIFCRYCRYLYLPINFGKNTKISALIQYFMIDIIYVIYYAQNCTYTPFKRSSCYLFVILICTLNIEFK